VRNLVGSRKERQKMREGNKGKEDRRKERRDEKRDEKREERIRKENRREKIEHLPSILGLSLTCPVERSACSN
jgi:hypothetical protein